MYDLNNILLKQISFGLDNLIFNSIHEYTKGIDNPILRASVSRIAEEVAVFSMTQSQNVFSDRIIHSPDILMGIHNPLDTIYSNSVNYNLPYILNEQLTRHVENKVFNLLYDELRSIFPESNFINFDNLAGIAIQSILPSLSNITRAAFNVLPLGQGLSNANKIFTNFISDNIFADVRNFQLGYRGDERKLITLERGFLDPTATYPKKEYVERSDVNKLAQGDVTNTIVISKEKERMTGAKLPYNDSWEQPKSSFKGQYPYNKVQETESGHVLEIDDTPQAERLHVYHRTGTFFEIDPEGNLIKRVVGSNYEIIDRNGKLSISGKADISIAGDCNLYVGNDANIEVEGDVNLTSYNDTNIQTAGKLNLSAGEEINLVSKVINISPNDVLNLHSNVINAFSIENFHLSSEHSLVLHPKKHIFLSPEDTLQVFAGKFYQTPEESYILSNAVEVGAFVPTAQGITKGYAEKSEYGSFEESRRPIDRIDIEDSLPLSFVDNFTVIVDEEGDDVNDHKKFLVSNGLTTLEELDSKPVVSESDESLAYNEKLVQANEKLKNTIKLPENYRISPNFTIGMISSKAAVTKDQIKNGENLKYGDIVYNLEYLSLNVLELAYEKFPNLFVTSGYRDPSRTKNKKSQHSIGQAVDIQFHDANKKDYYEIAKILAETVPYDQFILEYTSYSNNPWIHISLNSINNRKQIMTFWNHRKYKNGLHKIS